MAKYDVENFLADLKSVVTTNLATKLLAIDAEKNDGITMAPIDSGAYFFQSLAKSKAAAYPQFIYYGMEDPLADGIGPHTLEEHEIFFIVVVKDTAENEIYLTRLLRYSRALKEIFEESFTRKMSHIKILVSSLSPVSFNIEGIGNTFQGVGVKVKAKF